MQTITASLLAACSAAGQVPCHAVEISWSKTGSILGIKGSSGWTDESAYLVEHSGDLRINPPGDRLVMAGQVGTATVVLDNSTNRFSWMRSDSALYSYIGYANNPVGLAGFPIRIYAGYVTTGGQEFVRVFTGVITGWYERPDNAVELTCQDWGANYLQDKRSTVVVTNQLVDEWIDVLAGYAGISVSLLDLDVGIYQIPWCWMDDESIVEEIWQAVESEAGLAWFNQNGVLVFHNALAWVGLSSSWTFSDGTYELPDPSIDIDAVATKIKLEWSGRLAGPDTTIYTLDTSKVILPGQTVTWVARFNHAALAVSTPDYNDPYNDYYAVAGNGLDMTTSITVALTNRYAQQCTVAVTNNSAIHAVRLAVFKLRGMPLIGGPTEQTEVTVSPAPFDYERVRSERGNSYCQTAEQGGAIANVLALRARRVRPIWTLRNVPGLPHLELADLVTFQDTRSLGSGQSVSGLVIGINWQGGGSTGYIQQYRIMDVTDLYAYTNYFRIGTNKLGGPFSELDPETDYGRLYY